MINGEEDDVMPMPVLHSFSPSIVNCMRNLTTELTLSSDINLSEQAWNCLGCILSTNTSVTKLNISLCDLDVAWLCAGLQYNQNIKEIWFYGIDLGGVRAMNSLAPFLSDNPSLREINLSNCNVGTATIDILTNALANRAAGTLTKLFLDDNNLGDCNLDGLVTALSTCTKLISLSLCENGIGRRECAYLAQLLKSQESSLLTSFLRGNLFDDEGIEILSASLTNNTKLRILDLHGNNNISGSGWMTLLKLVCNTSSMAAVVESNHTLYGLGLCEGEMKAAIVSALDVNEANLLCASLKLNLRSQKLSVIRQKMIWAHVARGGIKFAGSDIPIGVMPIILSWFGDYSSEENAKLIQYHNPPPSEEEVNTKRLDSLYRIICDMPELCQNEPKSDADVKKPKLCHDVEQISLVESEDTSELAESLARSQRGEVLFDTILRICNVIALVLFSYSYMYGAQSGV